MPPIYVEIDMRCAMDELWNRTQTPELHRRWDLRFSDIRYLPRQADSLPIRFLYETRIGFGMRVAGEGETIGSHESDDSRTSSLKIWSADKKSLIREGSGYWQYIPTSDGIRFLTWYDYSTRFGVFGRLADVVVFRPLMGWATAWSFDRLRLWLEEGRDPTVALQNSVVYAISRLTVAFIWIYHGLVPKLLAADPEEIQMMLAAGFAPAEAEKLVQVAGVAEVAFGLAVLMAWRARSLLVLTAGLMVFALVGVALGSPHQLTAAFNPVSLNTAVIALSVVGVLVGKDLPTARRCRRKKMATTR